jgi:UDP-N-acetylglucosamine 1-carboxyvinyltransferase
MDEPSVMATENALMAAALTPGESIIGNAACEPHVQDLARMLESMGARIEGIGSNRIGGPRRRRARRLRAHRRPDHIEIGSFMAIAGMTGGELRIRDTQPRTCG